MAPKKLQSHNGRSNLWPPGELFHADLADPCIGSGGVMETPIWEETQGQSWDTLGGRGGGGGPSDMDHQRALMGPHLPHILGWLCSASLLPSLGRQLSHGVSGHVTLPPDMLSIRRQSSGVLPG